MNDFGLDSSYSKCVTDIFPQLSDIPNLGEEILVIGDGGMAVVIQSPQTGIIYKIPHQGSEQDIYDEFTNHEAFLLALREGREKGEIPDFIKIPSIRHRLLEHNGVFAQERVDGLTLKSIKLLKDFPGIPDNARNDMLNFATDYDVKKYFDEFLKIDPEDYDFSYNCNAIEVLGELVTEDKHSAFLKCLEFLKSRGCEHYDLHNSNVMLDRKGNIFIIDFGKIERYENKN